MLPIYESSNRNAMRCIHVEITNACNLVCSNCTRFVGHHKKPFFMDLEMVSKAIDSLEINSSDGFPGYIGIMGGEPTLHPKFHDICVMLQEKVADKNRRQLWTNGFKWEKHENVIYDTFYKHNVIYNDHKSPEGVHQPLLLAAKDLVEDEKYMWELIDECWIQKRWSASITPKGGFFCEVAAAQDYLFDGPGGYPLEKGWWRKTPADFQDQVQRYCQNCSAAVPMPRPKANGAKDLVSPSNQKKLEKTSLRYKRGNCLIVDRKMSKEEIERNKEGWRPWEHRQFAQSTPDLMAKEARLDYLYKEAEGTDELERMIKLGLLSEEDIIPEASKEPLCGK
jgi:hypothetical protein